MCEIVEAVDLHLMCGIMKQLVLTQCVGIIKTTYPPPMCGIIGRQKSRALFVITMKLTYSIKELRTQVRLEKPIQYIPSDLPFLESCFGCVQGQELQNY